MDASSPRPQRSKVGGQEKLARTPASYSRAQGMAGRVHVFGLRRATSSLTIGLTIDPISCLVPPCPCFRDAWQLCVHTGGRRSVGENDIKTECQDKCQALFPHFPPSPQTEPVWSEQTTLQRITSSLKTQLFQGRTTNPGRAVRRMMQVLKSSPLVIRRRYLPLLCHTVIQRGKHCCVSEQKTTDSRQEMR